MTNAQIAFLGYLVAGDFSKPEPPLSDPHLKELEDTGLIIWYDGYNVSYDGEAVYYLLRDYLKTERG